MKRKVFIIVGLILLSSILLVSAKDFEVNYLNPVNGEYEVTFSLTNYNVGVADIQGEQYTTLEFEGNAVTTEKGYAELPIIGAAVQVANDTVVSSSVIDSQYVDVPLSAPLKPSKGVIYRNQNPADIQLEIAPTSIVNEFYPQNILKTDGPFIFRDVRGLNISIYPFHYNAAAQTLRVYTSVTVKVTESVGRAANMLTDSGKILGIENGLYKTLFINYKEKRALNLAEEGDILVIYTDKFAGEIVPYVEWKTQKGYHVETKLVPTGTNVKTVISDAYAANPDLLYVQLVGDWADIQSDIGSSGNAPMDPMLGCVAGTDQYPDLIIGRFSATDAADVRVQVSKAINYEKNPDMNGSWYSTALGIASNEGAGIGDDNEADFEHMGIIKNNKLLPYTYTTVHEAHELPEKSIVTNAINGGLSLINYAGHGSHYAWGTSGYSTSDIAMATNGNMLPVIISVACINGEFHSGSDCFAEAWLKKANGGAVATIMATINQPWTPPMKGQDYATDILIGGYDYAVNPGDGTTVTEQRTTFGAITFNANILMYIEDNSAEGLDTLSTWTIFGDASLQVRTAKPAAIEVLNRAVLTGQPFATKVTSGGQPVAGATVSLSANGSVYSGRTDSLGNVVIDHALTSGDATLVVSGFNLGTIYETVALVDPVTPTPTVLVTPTPPVGLINLAPGKVIKASSQYANNFEATNASDLNEATLWASKLGTTPEWIYIDLGEVREVNGVGLRWFDKYYATTYQLAVSTDGVNWVFVYNKKNGKGGYELVLGTGNVRYIGLYMTGKNSIAYALTEFEIYGKKIVTTATPTATHTPTPTALGYTSISVQSAKNLIDTTPNLLILDVREKSEYDAGHLDGALLMPWNSEYLQAHHTELPTDRPILVYCRSGNRSRYACEFLSANGHTVPLYNMLGGYTEWTNVIKPTPTPTPGAFVNVAVDKAVEASSAKDCTCVIQFAVDGHLDTKWESGSLSSTEWMSLNLMDMYEIKEIVINWGVAYATRYTIEVSQDGVNWTTILEDNNGTGGIDKVSYVNDAQYFKVNMLEKSAANIEITELEVIGRLKL